MCGRSLDLNMDMRTSAEDGGCACCDHRQTLGLDLRRRGRFSPQSPVSHARDPERCAFVSRLVTREPFPPNVALRIQGPPEAQKEMREQLDLSFAIDCDSSKIPILVSCFVGATT